MKITSINKPNLINAYASQAQKDKAAKSSAKPAGDKVEISGRARELNKFRAELNNLPEVREEKVRQLKQRIKEGIYQPLPEKIAEGLINERRLDELV